ncbi:hypothetical protein ACFFJY_02145 [Fictibacillus aquaticus]|uniref:hypothetical protein n=1 Tax=Fictibacillus aquaticus TaxID=2021314 RepID=UPI0013FE319A|nr:hypothetical protein [Fictibacillus aquaticus]
MTFNMTAIWILFGAMAVILVLTSIIRFLLPNWLATLISTFLVFAALFSWFQMLDS